MTPPDRLRALLAEPAFVVMPAVWDGLTSKLTAQGGFKSAFLSGSCVAASRLGGPDLDLISFAEMFDSFDQVRAAAPDLLILADGDHGHGNAMNVQRTVHGFARAGFACAVIEDQVDPKRCGHTRGIEVVSRDAAEALLGATRAAELTLLRTVQRPLP